MLLLIIIIKEFIQSFIQSCWTSYIKKDKSGGVILASGSTALYNEEEFELKKDIKHVIYAKKAHRDENAYQILHFNNEQLKKLSIGVSETLKSSSETVKPNGGIGYRITKRTLDIILSSCALVVLSPLFLVVSAVIVIDDKGTPFFVQRRLTKDGKPFPMIKFRSMYMDAEDRFAEVQKLNQTDGLAFKMDNDPRVTKIGDFIRKTSIDELPQLVNVLLGHMSIIGPRPPLPREVLNYTPHQMNRLTVKGGLSCYCQCSGRSNMAFDEWVESDIEYIKNRSLAVDIKIIIKTILAVLKRDGAK